VPHAILLRRIDPGLLTLNQDRPGPSSGPNAAQVLLRLMDFRAWGGISILFFALYLSSMSDSSLPAMSDRAAALCQAHRALAMQLGARYAGALDVERAAELAGRTLARISHDHDLAGGDFANFLRSAIRRDLSRANRRLRPGDGR
jgi:hypothetical protein